VISQRDSGWSQREDVRVRPGITYKVSLHVLRSDLDGPDAFISSIRIDGQSVGGCNPYQNRSGVTAAPSSGCSFTSCGTWSTTIQSETGLVSIEMMTRNPSQNDGGSCECDTSTWVCMLASSGVKGCLLQSSYNHCGLT